jgi:Predicted extracellular nuclease
MKRGRILTSLILAIAMLITMIPMNPADVLAAKADHIVISEVYGGGGNNGATLKNDFIELYNPTSSDIDISGWQIQYASATGTFGSNNLVLVNAVIKAGGYFLIQAAKGTGGTEDFTNSRCNE